MKGSTGKATAAAREGEPRGARTYVADLARARDLARRAWPNDRAGSIELRDALFAHLLEEAGEMYGAARNLDGRSLRPDKPRGTIEELEDEIGDVGVLWLRIAEHYGVDPGEAVSRALDKFERRLLARSNS